MRRRRGSTREYVQRDNLEPRARCGGAPARQAGGVATRDGTAVIRPIRSSDPAGALAPII